MNTRLFEDRAQLDPCWIDSDISALVADYLRAQLDSGTKMKAQLDLGLKAQVDPGLKTQAQLDSGSKTRA